VIEGSVKIDDDRDSDTTKMTTAGRRREGESHIISNKWT